MCGRWLHTSPDQLCNVAVAGDFAMRNLLHGAVDGMEEGLCLFGASHLSNIEFYGRREGDLCTSESGCV